MQSMTKGFSVFVIHVCLLQFLKSGTIAVSWAVRYWQFCMCVES